MKESEELCPICEAFAIGDDSFKHQSFDLQIMKQWYERESK